MTKLAKTNAIAPVAALIIAGRPRKKAITMAMQKDAYKPTCGETPAMIEKAIATVPNTTESPDKISALGLASQFCEKFLIEKAENKAVKIMSQIVQKNSNYNTV